MGLFEKLDENVVYGTLQLNISLYKSTFTAVLACEAFKINTAPFSSWRAVQIILFARRLNKNFNLLYCSMIPCDQAFLRPSSRTRNKRSQNAMQDSHEPENGEEEQPKLVKRARADEPSLGPKAA